MSEDTPIALGTFDVSGSSAEASAFCAATGAAQDGDRLPLTFPMRWIVRHDIRAALLGLIDDPSMVLVHEAQDFEYQDRLRSGTAYRLHVSARRTTAPERLVAEARIEDDAGRAFGCFESTLRLIKAPE